MPKQKYHKYVFDEKTRKFIGDFETMYREEDRQGYDSWFQEDLTCLSKRVSSLIVNQHKFKSILDIGCGKGVFTNTLKKAGNAVVGIDISRTAIIKAKARYRSSKFFVSDIEPVLNRRKMWDLVVMMDLLSYIKSWKNVLAAASRRAQYLYISLWLPQRPRGFVKSLDELRLQVERYFDIETLLLWNHDHIFILAKNKKEV
ncbi:MAG: class I SAM-dependent methyltransferase [Candidatus Omnitrophica bacterium]|nr:class I SAM-dependent methyltransferase [Candidatus Omnitrophota bacterium]